MLADPGAVEGLLATGSPVEALVPADVEGLRLVTRVLRSSAETLEAAGRALSRVEVTQWRGAASGAFGERIAGEPGRWQSAAAAFRAGAGAVERFGEDVLAARAVAATALDVYRRYLESVDGLAPGAVPVGAALGVGMGVSRLESAVATAAASGDPATAAQVSAAAFAADGLRRQALDLMDRAHTQVSGAGDLAERALRSASANAPEARRFWESTIRPADAVGAGHIALDTIGLLPVAGALADGANALWYLGADDYPNAGLSAVGLVPVVGEAVILSKFGRRIAVQEGVLTGGRAGADILGRDTIFRLGDGGLLGHELADAAHTVARHVAQSDTQLAQRLLDEPHLTRASTFTTLAEAERYTYANLGAHRDEIAAFMTSDARRIQISMTFDHPIGHTLVRGADGTVDTSTVVSRLQKDATMPNGYRIVTSFPHVP